VTIKFISLNLWQGGNLFNDILSFLDKEDADILVLQEVYDGKDLSLADKYRSVDVIQQRFNFPALDFAPAFLDNRSEGNIVQGNAIFSRLPIISSEVTFFNEPYRTDYVEIPANFPTCPRNLQHVTLQTPAGEVNVFNFQGVWDMDGDNYSEQRRKMSELIIKDVKDKHNVLLAGDTNAKPSNKAIKNIEKYLSSVFGNKLVTTFNMKRKDDPGYGTAAVDMIFTSPNIKVILAECPKVDISDHLPLVAILEI